MASMADGIKCKVPPKTGHWSLSEFIYSSPRRSQQTVFLCILLHKNPCSSSRIILCITSWCWAVFESMGDLRPISRVSHWKPAELHVLTPIVCSLSRHLLKMNKSSSDLEKVSQSSAESLSPSFRGAHVSFTTGSTDSLASDSRTCSDGGNKAVLNRRASDLQSLQSRPESVARI